MDHETRAEALRRALDFAIQRMHIDTLSADDVVKVAESFAAFLANEAPPTQPLRAVA